ncbi:MAG: hypothetical protein Q8N08_00325 [Methanobacteriaceae archaeon]|nr:hypothetical protein [Methanobacteriaceae archaeon]
MDYNIDTDDLFLSTKANLRNLNFNDRMMFLIDLMSDKENFEESKSDISVKIESTIKSFEFHLDSSKPEIAILKKHRENFLDYLDALYFTCFELEH